MKRNTSEIKDNLNMLQQEHIARYIQTLEKPEQYMMVRQFESIDFSVLNTQDHELEQIDKE